MRIQEAERLLWVGMRQLRIGHNRLFIIIEIT
jgi:hypothetical protein